MALGLGAGTGMEHFTEVLSFGSGLGPGLAARTAGSWSGSTANLTGHWPGRTILTVMIVWLRLALWTGNCGLLHFVHTEACPGAGFPRGLINGKLVFLHLLPPPSSMHEKKPRKKHFIGSLWGRIGCRARAVRIVGRIQHTWQQFVTVPMVSAHAYAYVYVFFMLMFMPMLTW